MTIGTAPIGAAPIGALADSGPIELVAMETFAASDAGVPDVTIPLVAALTLDAAIAPKVLDNLIASLAATSAVHGSFSLRANASDALDLQDGVLAAWQLLLEEEIATVGAALGSVRKLAALADALAATGVVVGNRTAFVALIQALTLEGLIRTGFQPDAVDALTLSEATASNARLLSTAAEALLASDAGAPTLRISAIAADAVAFDSPADALLRANEDLADGVVLYLTLRLGDTDYVGWALNTQALAASQYRSAPFDSYASFRGRDYAAGPNGLVELTGSDDDGQAINWSLRTFLMDFGTSKFKRVPDVYIGATTDGTLVLKVTTRDPGTGVQTEDWYQVARAPAAGPGTGRVKVARGLKSQWWGYELTNLDGAALDGLDAIALRPLILDRRV